MHRQKLRRVAAGLACALAAAPVRAAAEDPPDAAPPAGLTSASRRPPEPGGAPVGDDDPFAGAPALERAALVREVLRRNPNLAAMREGWRAALARPAQAGALPDPMLEYAVGPWSFGRSDVEDAHRVELRQPLPFPGKLRLRGEIAAAEAEAAGLDFEAARVRLASLASIAFDDLALATRSAQIARESLELLDELQRVATARYAAGLVSQAAPLEAESERAMLEHRVVEIESEQRITAERIDALLHRRAASPLPPPRLDAAPPPAMADVESLAARALATRPEVRAAEARVAARARSVDLARREFWPDFEVFGSYDGFWQEPPLRGAVGVAVNLPLNLNRRRGALEEARAETARARSEVSRVEDQVRLAVVSAVERLREAHHLLDLARDRVLPAARDRVRAARVAVESGQEPFSTWIDAERALRDAELGVAEAEANVGRRHAELDRAVGALPAGAEGDL